MGHCPVAPQPYVAHCRNFDSGACRFIDLQLVGRRKRRTDRESSILVTCLGAWDRSIHSTRVALLQRSKGRSGAFLTAAGLVAIVAATGTFREGTGFPSTAALLPTVGAAAVIAGGWLAPQATMTKLLASRPLVAIGLLSYSWYLC
jgi:peptidoglycan/LPS O-acetylase OafA/YrhL